MLEAFFSFVLVPLLCFFFLVVFFFNDTATTEIYTLSLHDALPIPDRLCLGGALSCNAHGRGLTLPPIVGQVDRKSTRLNSSHSSISYAVFCLKKKKKMKFHKVPKKNKKTKEILK